LEGLHIYGPTGIEGPGLAHLAGLSRLKSLILLYRGLDSSQRFWGQFLPSRTFHGGGPVMDRRFDTRLREMLAQAQVSPDLIKGLLSRLGPFVQPFTASLAEPEQRRHTVEYLAGLLSKLKHKT